MSLPVSKKNTKETVPVRISLQAEGVWSLLGFVSVSLTGNLKYDRWWVGKQKNKLVNDTISRRIN